MVTSPVAKNGAMAQKWQKDPNTKDKAQMCTEGEVDLILFITKIFGKYQGPNISLFWILNPKYFH